MIVVCCFHLPSFYSSLGTWNALLIHHSSKTQNIKCSGSNKVRGSVSCIQFAASLLEGLCIHRFAFCLNPLTTTSTGKTHFGKKISKQTNVWQAPTTPKLVKKGSKSTCLAKKMNWNVVSTGVCVFLWLLHWSVQSWKIDDIYDVFCALMFFKTL